MFWSVFILLQMCEQAGEDLVPCEGQCCGMFHLHCVGQLLKPDEKLLCQECSSGGEFALILNDDRTNVHSVFVTIAVKLLL